MLLPKVLLPKVLLPKVVLPKEIDIESFISSVVKKFFFSEIVQVIKLD